MLFPAVEFRLEVLEECASTQEVLLARRGQSGFHGAAVLALRQTQGRGRRGRTWDMSVGNLALSFALEVADEALPLLTFASGLALHAVATRFLPSAVDLRLKWPNDLYLGGRKLAGMLAQGRQVPGHGAEVVIGVGVNLAWAPTGVDAVCMAEIVTPPSPLAFAREFLAELREVFDEKRDFEVLRADWEEAARLGEGKLLIVGEQGYVRAEALLPTGELLVRSDDGLERKLASEEVSLRFE